LARKSQKPLKSNIIRMMTFQKPTSFPAPLDAKAKSAARSKCGQFMGNLQLLSSASKAPPKTARNQLLAITVDETGLTISGTDLQQTSSN